MQNDFLFELGCEELPSAAVLALSNALVTKVTEMLTLKGLQFDTISSYATPRRLAFIIHNLVESQPDQLISRKGPSLAAAYDGSKNPTQALLGFAKSNAVSVEDLVILNTEKGDWIYYEALAPGLKSIELLPGVIDSALGGLPISKPMRWGDGELSFVRPVHWAVMMYGETLIKTTVLGVQTTQLTYGHRFHHPEPLLIKSPKHYESVLTAAQVTPDFSKRRQVIIDQVKQLAATLNADAIMPESLVDEVTSIVEWPHALIAQFEEKFLTIPKEVLIASMQSHQKCFAVVDADQKLLPYFITVSNIDSLHPKQVIQGNEKVMRARLSDAAFFFEQDSKQALSDHIPSTGNVVFQAKLGSLLDKTERIQRAIKSLVMPLGLDLKDALRAVALSKCDLMTGMVSEFPELQGLMGYYYAQQSGESESVSIALNEQYWPRFSEDELPRTALGTALSLLDRLDTLVGSFMIGEKPTVSKDPFKLRRHALAVARLLINNPSKLLLSELILWTTEAYQDQLNLNKSLLPELHGFILERLPAYYQNQGISNDQVNAVLSRQSDCLFDFDQRIKALTLFVQSSDSTSLSAACKRVSNLLKPSEIDRSHLTELDSSLFEEDAEKSLFAALECMEEQITQLCRVGDYSMALKKLAKLRAPIDVFFEKVMVLVDNQLIKINRLALLRRLQSLLQVVADISLLSQSV